MTKKNVKETAAVAGMKWTVLDKVENGYLCIADSIGNRKFGHSNNWKESDIRKELAKLAEKIEKELGIELPEMKRDLLSLDGQTEYGSCMDKVSLITVDEYRKHREKLPNTGIWWWTITPWSTPKNDWKYSVTVVAPSGIISYDDYDYYDGVRPVCILPSYLFESEEE